MNKYTLSSLVLLMVLSTSWGLTTKLDNYEQFCTWKKVDVGTTFAGSYIVSGFSEEKVTAMVFSPTSKMLYKNDNQREGKFELTTDEEGEYRVCFRSGDRQEKFVSFEFHTLNKQDGGHAVTSKHIDNVYTDLRDTVYLLRRISRNQYFQNTRDNVHLKNIKGLESKINWSTFFKVLALIIIAGGQVYVLTGFFKKRTNLRV